MGGHDFELLPTITISRSRQPGKPEACDAIVSRLDGTGPTASANGRTWEQAVMRALKQFAEQEGISG